VPHCKVPKTGASLGWSGSSGELSLSVPRPYTPMA
jgi:hypothetical protein